MQKKRHREKRCLFTRKGGFYGGRSMIAPAFDVRMFSQIVRAHFLLGKLDRWLDASLGSVSDDAMAFGVSASYRAHLTVSVTKAFVDHEYLISCLFLSPFLWQLPCYFLE